jgi:hypothetical protein
MNKYFFYLILAVLLSSCAGAQFGPFTVDKPWGGSAPYGEGIHPIKDFFIERLLLVNWPVFIGPPLSFNKPPRADHDEKDNGSKCHDCRS